jgi:hypothetical protein
MFNQILDGINHIGLIEPFVVPITRGKVSRYVGSHLQVVNVLILGGTFHGTHKTVPQRRRH